MPGYLAFTPNIVSRFQIAMPKHRQWTKWAGRNGFQHEGPGPGDHEIWMRDGNRIQINKKHDECDIASIKAVARLEGKTLRQLVDEIRAG